MDGFGKVRRFAYDGNIVVGSQQLLNASPHYVGVISNQDPDTQGL